MVMPYRPKEKTAEAILEFAKQSCSLVNQQWNLRARFEGIDRQYMREVDFTEDQWKAKQANLSGDPDKYQNIVLPLVMPQVESAVTYQQSVFLSGFPIFGAAASPEHVDAATQMDTIIGQQQIHGNWVPEILKSLRNGFKYNIGPTEVSWDSQVSYSLETPMTASGGDEVDKQKEVIWSGNTIKALDPYNTFWDTRVDPVDVPAEAEFAGYTMSKSRIALKKYIAALPSRINVKEAFESGSAAPSGGNSGIETYYSPNINPEAIYDSEKYVSTNWLSWAGMASNKNPRIKYGNIYEVMVLYGRILPEDFDMKDVPAKSTPQVWKFIIVNNKVLVYAERMTNVHNLIPIFFCAPLDDGMGYQTKSFAKNIEPFQQITTALSNSMIAARRRAISDRMLYDPSRVSSASVRSDSPVARIPVRPSAYGTPLSEAVYPIPFEDSQSQYSMSAIQSFTALANQVSGLNPARQGQFVKGNKTRFEFEETMGYANGRDQTVALNLEGNFFSPIKEVIKTNILQYQGGVELYNREQETMVKVDPVSLRKAKLEFKVSDGLLPSDKLVDGESLAMAFQAISQSPQVGQGFNIAPMFSYLMKTRGAKLQPFEKSPEQLAYEQAQAVWQQSIAAISENLGNMADTIDPEEFQKMLPPQPTPEQFGYTPGAPNVSLQNDGETVMDKYSQVTQQQAQAMQQAQAQAQQQGPAAGGSASGTPSGAGGEQGGQQ
jgi:hypothetical protein